MKEVWSSETVVRYFHFNIVAFPVMSPQGPVGGYRIFAGRYWLKLKPFYRDG
jgi:hypothetical protein